MRTIHSSLFTDSSNPLEHMPSSSEVFGAITVQSNFGILIVMPVLIVLMRRIMKRMPQNLDIGAEINAIMRGRLSQREMGPQEARRTESAGRVDGSGTVEILIQDMLKEKPVRFSPQQLVAFTQNFSTKLGSGGFGHVYRGVLPDGVQIAVKVLKHNSGQDKRMEEQFMAEVSTIGRTYHRNLVRLYGFCFDSQLKALVYEYMENGSLDTVLFGREHRIEWEKLYEIAVGAAKGLKYLHDDCHKRIIHHDIKPGNVLLDSNFCPKLADFGLAKLSNMDSTHENFSGGGTPGYAAPEVWMPFQVTYKCDVYSFGMMLFEIVGRRRNFYNFSGEEQDWFPRRVWDKFDEGELEGLLLERGIKEKAMVKAKKMCMVALWCVQYLPQDRPSMDQVLKILEGGDQTTTPKNPFQHLALSSDMPPISIESSTNSRSDETTDNSSAWLMNKYEREEASSSG